MIANSKYPYTLKECPGRIYFGEPTSDIYKGCSLCGTLLLKDGTLQNKSVYVVSHPYLQGVFGNVINALTEHFSLTERELLAIKGIRG